MNPINFLQGLISNFVTAPAQSFAQDFLASPTPTPAKKGLTVTYDGKTLDEFISGKGGSAKKTTKTQTKTKMPQKAGTTNIDPNILNFLTNTVFPITRQAGIPDAVAAGQFAGEGRLKGLGASRNNYFNLGAFDSNLGNTHSYKTPEEGIQAYVNLLTQDPRYKSVLQFAHDPASMLNAIQGAGYAGDPKTYSKRANNNYNSYTDFITNTPEYRYFTQ